MSFRILSWNINGLRSFKTGMKDFLSTLEADIICLQETKVTRDMLEEPLAIVEGYSSYFSFSRKRSGYSGVATFCSEQATPIAAQEGLSGNYVGELLHGGGATEALPSEWAEEELKDLDSEGRAIITQHNIKDNSGTELEVALINVYCPRVDPEKPERLVYKMRFYELLRQRAAAIRATGCHVIILGDVNTSHKRIDHCDPDETEVFERRLERRYLDKFLAPLYKKEDSTENYGENIDKGCEIKGISCDNLCKDQLDSHVKMSRDSISLPIVELGQEIFNCITGGESLIPTDISAQVKLVKESTKEQVKANRKKEEKTVNNEECEEDEISNDHLLVSQTDFQVVDTFRYFYPNRRDVFSCWNTFTNSRSTNYGTRIDYVFCDEEFLQYVGDSLVLSDVMGSDHCPVAVVIKGESVPASKPPLSCTKFFPEFRGQQQKLSSYFQPKSFLPDDQSGANQNPCTFSKAGCMTVKSLQSTAKRKANTIKIKPPASKKVCLEKQRKLSSFFTSKGNDQNRSTVLLNSEITSRYENQSPKLNEWESAQAVHTNPINSSQMTGPDEELSVCSQDVSSDGVPVSIARSKSYPETALKSNQMKNSGWSFLMKGPRPPPVCAGHKEPAVLLTVKKKGPNMNRQFYACARGVGKEGDPNARCNFFKWLGK